MVKNISNSLTCTVASSCVCTSPLAVMTIVGLHDFVKISISAEFKSFLLNKCIDAPESTTNSRSSNLRFDAGRHLFSEGEGILFRVSPLIFWIFLANFLAAFTGTLLLPLSPPESDPQILEHWGYAHKDHLGQIYPSEGFWSRILV